MIYVSSSAIKTQKICKAIEVLVKTGFRNIELSGGTDYYEGLEEEIFALKQKYSLNYILHNYFPPPKQPELILKQWRPRSKTYMQAEIS